MRGPRVKEPCGCVHNHYVWLSMCLEHASEWRNTHERWYIERFGIDPKQTTTPASANPPAQETKS